MTFENSPYFKSYEHKKISLSFGDFYFLDHFLISELNEGIHLDWKKILEVIAEIKAHYGPNKKLAYISNRVNSYSIEPHLWINFNKEFGFIMASAIISYSEMNYINATLEKRFSTKSLKRCTSLEQAIEWVENLREFNQNKTLHLL
ncbi:hypothetical protein IA57_00035 [Mangrovimonas yunxiaonensis]|uniref:STAS/SEC14 domain-containing protein n=1 Tax=Mangrovimonas yunxiaonensis TaxID=1197477 RepID=A0A084TMY3_9FLAO|nr:hypothetical protein [Mangrovimonas yunxiaonensis]KFB02069.1 hypothetical protein IA57_00035 [Mangrovimonas yunxiaonensis]GGH48139.1 hypothetical protein GCM10011364_23480 [Mangrovimonas yunxiaonensis]